MVTNVCSNIDAEPTVRGDCFVEAAIERGDQRLQVGPLPTGAQSNARLVLRWRHRLEAIHPDVHPHAVEGLLDRGGNARLPGTGHTIQEDNTTRFGEWHVGPLLGWPASLSLVIPALQFLKEEMIHLDLESSTFATSEPKAATPPRVEGRSAPGAEVDVIPETGHSAPPCEGPLAGGSPTGKVDPTRTLGLCRVCARRRCRRSDSPDRK